MKLSYYLKVLFNLSVEIPMMLLSYIVVPIALLFCKKESEHLPKWARWFEDAHDTYEGKSAAINGDDGWRKEHYPEPKNRTYIARLKWLMRNKIGYFTTRVIGVDARDIDPKSFTVKIEGDPNAMNSRGRTYGKILVEAKTKKGRKLFAYYLSKPYTKKLWLRVFLGYKIQDLMNLASSQNPEKDMEAYLAEKDNKKFIKTVAFISPFRIIKKG